MRKLVACLYVPLLAAVFIVSLAGAQEATEKAPLDLKRLITVETGEIPIILSAPHGGNRGIQGVGERKGGAAKQFVTVTDTNSHRLTQAVAKSIERRWAKPHVVIALFSRKYIDANRPAEDAFESENAKSTYDAYHGALAEAVESAREKFGRGLLLDIHGQAAKPTTIYRGTANGKTCSLLLDRLGPGGLMGDQGFLGILAKAGYEIHPERGSDAKEDSRYNGGYIVRTYGALGATGIDAVQLEVGGDFRKASAIDKTAEDIAQAICKFADVYFADARKAAGRAAP
jgi:N-formylglutamate amidohydrolase